MHIINAQLKCLVSKVSIILSARRIIIFDSDDLEMCNYGAIFLKIVPICLCDVHCLTNCNFVMQVFSKKRHIPECLTTVSLDESLS